MTCANHSRASWTPRIRGIPRRIGETLLCGYSRIGGWAVGIVANQKKHVQTLARARTEALEFGGVIYPSRGKGRAIYSRLHQNRIPLIFLPT